VAIMWQELRENQQNALKCNVSTGTQQWTGYNGKRWRVFVLLFQNCLCCLQQSKLTRFLNT